MAYTEQIVEIANVTNYYKADPHVELYSAVDQLCELGVSVQVTGLRSVHRIEDMMARIPK